MFKRITMIAAFAFGSATYAFADVDVNKADQAALDGIRGLGPTTSKAILAERTKGGNFKDWIDFENRVKGIRSKKAKQLSDAGLTVNGQTRKLIQEKADIPKPKDKSKLAPAPSLK